MRRAFKTSVISNFGVHAKPVRKLRSARVLERIVGLVAVDTGMLYCNITPPEPALNRETTVSKKNTTSMRPSFRWGVRR